jgi:glycosyltransferase involved in cell wall biosynthesis
VGEDNFVLGWVGHDQFRKQVWVLFELLYHLRSGTYIRCRTCGRVTVREFDHLTRSPRVTGRLRTYEPNYDYGHCWYCHSGDVARGEPKRNVVLFTVMANNLEVGWDLRLLVETFGLHDVVFDGAHGRPEAGYTTAELAQIYNCFDALVFPSGAEGFGMPVLEAMACGVPVVYANYSGHAEFAVGRPVRVRLVPDTPDPSFLGFVDMGDLIANTLDLVEDAVLQRELAGRALDKARAMDWDAFTPQWQDLLARSPSASGQA